MALLDINNLTIAIYHQGRQYLVVEDLSLSVADSEIVGIVGESGCGKSLTSLAIMGLLPPGVQITKGEVYFDGNNILQMPLSKRRQLMGCDISMIFQEPMTSLNPVYTVGYQIEEAILHHKKCSSRLARKQAIELLSLVGIPDPDSRIKSYPHELSGGMRQRVMIAIALSCNPKLLIADEPTTALDVTIQAQILSLLKTLQQRRKMAVILISHDLGVIAQTAARTCVMYRGRMIETAPTDDIFTNPHHPYSYGLLKSIPDPDKDIKHINTISGFVPPITETITGCAFHPRCQQAKAYCQKHTPRLKNIGKVSHINHSVSCHYPISV